MSSSVIYVSIFICFIFIVIHYFFIREGLVPIQLGFFTTEDKKRCGALIILISVICILLTISAIVLQLKNLSEQSGFLIGIIVVDLVLAIINGLIVYNSL